MGALLRLASLGVLALSGCAAPQQSAEPGPSLFLPHHDVRDGPTALIIGTLNVRDGCVWINTDDGGSDLILWPQGVSLGVAPTGTIEVVAMPGATAPIPMGSTVELGGGEYKDEQFVTQLIGGGSIPQPCRSERYWLATGLEKVGR
jgi:hypothetical protein